MPKVKPGESKEDYVSRAIPILKKEGLTDKQAQGKAFGMFETQTKKNEVKVYRHKKTIYKYSKNKQNQGEKSNLDLNEFFQDNPYLRAKIDQFDIEQIKKGLQDEYNEHYDDAIPDIKKLIGKIVIDHLLKDSQYYSKYD
jgi:hypothetical protein